MLSLFISLALLVTGFLLNNFFVPETLLLVVDTLDEPLYWLMLYFLLSSSFSLDCRLEL